MTTPKATFAGLALIVALCAGFTLGLTAPAGAGSIEGAAAYLRGDYATALREYRPLAKQGNAEAQFFLGVMYEQGQGVPQDYAKAVKWHRMAAEQGYADAQHTLGVMYEYGEGVRQDYAEAVGWYRKAAAQGYAEAQNVLGFMYGEGQGVPQDYVQSHMWLNIAAPRFPPGEHRDNAVNNRDIVAKRMTPAQKSEAEQLGKEWLVEHPEVR